MVPCKNDAGIFFVVNLLCFFPLFPLFFFVSCVVVKRIWRQMLRSWPYTHIYIYIYMYMHTYVHTYICIYKHRFYTPPYAVAHIAQGLARKSCSNGPILGASNRGGVQMGEFLDFCP